MRTLTIFWLDFEFKDTSSFIPCFSQVPTTKPEVSLVKADLPGVLLDEGEVCFSHVVELECKKSLSVVPSRLLAFGGVLRSDHTILQLVVPAHRVLWLAVVILGGQLLVLTGLVVLLICLHLTWMDNIQKHLNGLNNKCCVAQIKYDISQGLQVKDSIVTCLCVCGRALTRRPLFQQSISAVTIDSMLFGGLRLFTVLFILLYWRSNKSAANTKSFWFLERKMSYMTFSIFLLTASTTIYREELIIYHQSWQALGQCQHSTIWPNMETNRRTRGAGAACYRVCLHWGFWGQRWGTAVRREACWCGCSLIVCTSPSGALGSLHDLYPPLCLLPVQICREKRGQFWCLQEEWKTYFLIICLCSNKVILINTLNLWNYKVKTVNIFFFVSLRGSEMIKQRNYTTH